MDGTVQLLRRHIGFVTPEAFFAPLAKLPTGRLYSGGLGVLSSTMADGAYALGVKLSVFTILPRYGYYEQVVENGRMGVRFEANYLEGVEKEDCGLVTIRIAGSPVHIRVWRLPSEAYETSDYYLLDTDIPENPDRLAKVNTHHLYGGPRAAPFGPANLDEEWSRKIAQTMVLGLGAVAAARMLKLDIDLWHGNDCHTVFTPLALLKEVIERGESDLDEAILEVKERWAYTTHTSVMAGNWSAGLNLVCHLVQDSTLTRSILQRLGRAEDDEVFEFTPACLRLAGAANAVSRKHEGVSRRLWSFLGSEAPEITHVTNGTSRRYWQAPEFRDACTPDELRAAKQSCSEYLRAYVWNLTGKELAASGPNMVWARRGAGYKRAKLLVQYQRDWLVQMLRESRFSYIIAGKPHPDDQPMVDAWNELNALSQELPNLAVLPNYDMAMSRVLKTGAHLWLNCPRSSDEACGTSGMSAAMNGAVNVSTRDGWMYEANQSNFYGFGLDHPGPSIDYQDRFDAEKLVEALEEALGAFANPDTWFALALLAKREAETDFDETRMVRDYLHRLWNPLHIAVPAETVV